MTAGASLHRPRLRAELPTVLPKGWKHPPTPMKGVEASSSSAGGTLPSRPVRRGGRGLAAAARKAAARGAERCYGKTAMLMVADGQVGESGLMEPCRCEITVYIVSRRGLHMTAGTFLQEGARRARQPRRRSQGAPKGPWIAVAQITRPLVSLGRLRMTDVETGERGASMAACGGGRVAAGEQLYDPLA